jgi:phosphomannomutase
MYLNIKQMKKTLLLFDVDGTLTKPRLKITNDMVELLQKLSKKDTIELGFVGGSDIEKQKEQLGEENFHLFTWKCSENGLLTYHNEKVIHKVSMINNIGEETYQRLVNACLKIMSELTLPKKRGTFIELRNGMINVSPIGRSCSQEVRDEFVQYDKEHKVKETFVRQLQESVPDLCDLLQFSIGGQISIDIFPKGWNKTYCLQFLTDTYETIYFFGDKTMEGGNDYEIYKDPRVKGTTVTSYHDTMNFLQQFI